MELTVILMEHQLWFTVVIQLYRVLDGRHQSRSSEATRVDPTCGHGEKGKVMYLWGLVENHVLKPGHQWTADN